MSDGSLFVAANMFVTDKSADISDLLASPGRLPSATIMVVLHRPTDKIGFPGDVLAFTSDIPVGIANEAKGPRSRTLLRYQYEPTSDVDEQVPDACGCTGGLRTRHLQHRHPVRVSVRQTQRTRNRHHLVRLMGDVSLHRFVRPDA